MCNARDLCLANHSWNLLLNQKLAMLAILWRQITNRIYQMLPHSNELSMTVLMTPDKANFSGNVHGGDLLKLLDQVAYACASRFAGNQVVTLSVDQVIFNQPIHVGELVTFLASVNYTGRTSIEVGVKVISEDILTKVVRHVNSCFITMVAMDSERRPTEVPKLLPLTEDQQRRYRAAELRREMRGEFEDRFNRIRESESKYDWN